MARTPPAFSIQSRHANLSPRGPRVTLSIISVLVEYEEKPNVTELVKSLERHVGNMRSQDHASPREWNEMWLSRRAISAVETRAESTQNDEWIHFSRRWHRATDSNVL